MNSLPVCPSLGARPCLRPCAQSTPRPRCLQLCRAARSTAAGEKLLQLLQSSGTEGGESDVHIATAAQLVGTVATTIASSRDWSTLRFTLKQLDIQYKTSERQASKLEDAAASAGSSNTLSTSISRLLVLGLGSISDCGSIQAGSGPPKAGRASFRLHQLALAMSLHKLFPNCSQAVPIFLDPAFTHWDQQLIQALGGQVLPHDQLDTLLVQDTSNSAGTLLYMPCCPRSLYAQVIRTGLQAGTLPRTIILGNSFRALSDSNMLLQALMRGPGPALGAGGQPRPSFPGLPGPILDDAGDEDEEGDTPALLLDLVADQAFLELPCPDCGAHGVAVSMHAFPPARLQRLRPQGLSP